MHSSDDRAHRAATASTVGVAMAFAAACLFAVNGTVSKVVLSEHLSSLRLVQIRCTCAAVVFAALALWRAPSSLRITWRDLRFLAVFATVGLAMVQWLYFVAIARMPVSISLLIEFTAPLLVALWVRFVRGEAVRSRVWAALGAILVGLALVAQVWDGLTLDAVGIVASMLAAISLAAYFLLGERGLVDKPPLALAAWSFALAGLFWSLLLPWRTYPFSSLAGQVDLAQVSDGRLGGTVPVWVLVAWVVLLGTVAPFGLVLGGLSRIGAARSGLIGTAEPALAGMVAWVVIGEQLAPVQIAGAAVVLAGIVLAETARARVPASSSLPEGMAPT